MARIALENVTVDFPVYGSSRSFRKELFRAATGGVIKKGNKAEHRVSVLALDQLNLTIEHGTRLGLVGHNGAGKSTLLKVIAGVYNPTAGHITVEGRVSPLFSAAPGAEMDDTGYENLVTCGLFLGMTREEIAAKTPEIEEFCELGEYLNLPMRVYSAGMMTRLSFALATALDPEILLLDEGIGTGDARFAEKAAKRIERLVDRAHMLVLASHSDDLIRKNCNKAVLMEKGRILTVGNVDEVLETYHRRNTDTSAAPAPEATASA